MWRVLLLLMMFGGFQVGVLLGVEGGGVWGKEVVKSVESDEQVMAAVAEDRVEELTRFLDRGGDTNKFFALAVSDGSIACVKLMLSRGAKVNRLDEHGMTPLMVAAKYAYRGGRDMVEFLLSQGADVNARSKKGSTALMFACYSVANHYDDLYAEVVQLLIDKGAMVNVKNQLGATPLSIAEQGNSPTIVAILKKAGAKS